MSKINDGSFAFCGFTGELIIPTNIKTIGSKAFEGCRHFSGDLSMKSKGLKILQDPGSNFNTIEVLSPSVTEKGKFYRQYELWSARSSTL